MTSTTQANNVAQVLKWIEKHPGEHTADQIRAGTKIPGVCSILSKLEERKQVTRRKVNGFYRYSKPGDTPVAFAMLIGRPVEPKGPVRAFKMEM